MHECYYQRSILYKNINISASTKIELKLLQHSLLLG